MSWNSVIQQDALWSYRFKWLLYLLANKYWIISWKYLCRRLFFLFSWSSWNNGLNRILISQWTLGLFRFKHRNLSDSRIKRESTNSHISESSFTKEGEQRISKTITKRLPQWEKDFHLIDNNNMDLFHEYLEMGLCFDDIILILTI